MKNIIKFKDFSAIKESSEFSTQNPGSVGNGSSDPSLSIGGFDKQQNMVQQGMAFLNGLAAHISPSINGLKGKIALEDQDITNITILRIVQRNTLAYDVYVKFIIQDLEYWGVVVDITSMNAILNSEVFNDSSLIQSKEWIIRTKGFIIKTIRSWLDPKIGKYKLIGDDVQTINLESGAHAILKTGTVIDIIRVSEYKILISVNNERYTLINKNYIYFNWWFEIVS